MIDFEKICTEVCRIARATGEYIATERESFSLEDIEQKGSHNLVSYVDKTAEKQIVAALRELLPGAGFITEEGSATSAGEEFRWIIDPLDGTTNFIHGCPPYSVSIALAQGAELVVGVVYEVTLKELFYAWKGSDAYLNGRKIGASQVRQVENSLIAVGFSYAASQSGGEHFTKLAYYQRNSDGIRRMGSAAVDAVYVACGRFDAFVQSGLAPWDVAAGALIALRAGARVSDFAGGDDYVFGGTFVATNAYIYDEFMKTI
ncbi:inositol monophosphatase [Bacteroidia bacterium]|nr:inositol monophosphatase [Bacteroidia bacterium]